MRSSLLLNLVLAATAALGDHVLHEKRNQFAVNRGWSEHAVNDRSIEVRAAIGLKQRNLEKAEDFIADVSHPGSTNYGKFWSFADIQQVFNPSMESKDAVMNWLSESGIQGAEHSLNGGWMEFVVPIQQLEGMLNTTFYQYRNDRTGESSFACQEYSLPSEIAHHVDYVLPGVNPISSSKTKQHRQQHEHRSLPIVLPGPATESIVPQALAVIPAALTLPPDLQYCGYNITPSCLRALYDLPYPSPALADGELGILESGSSYSQADLDDFFTKYAREVANSTHPFLISINGGTAPTSENPSKEADLDFQVAYGLLGASNVTLYQGQKPENYKESPPEMTNLLDALDGSFCTADQRSAGFMCGGVSLTNVLSVSQAAPELFEQSAAYQRRACHEFMKLGLQGKTILFASGDYGVAANPQFGAPFDRDNGCAPQNLKNSPQNNTFFNGTIFMPNFPSNCPYVLSVGATQLDSNETVRDSERAMNLPYTGLSQTDQLVTFASSGGFANYFKRPRYQDEALRNYFSGYEPSYRSYASNNLDVSNNSTNIGKNGGIYNRAGRGIPDVSANGAHFMSFWRGIDRRTDGTSVATPIWGSIVAMLNSERAKIGKGPVGFINHVLYRHPEVFHDITRGRNPGCDTEGFEAVEGWDPITGLGTPNYPALRALFLSLP